MKIALTTILVLAAAGLAKPGDAAVPTPWRLTLADTVEVAAGPVTIADVATGAVPAAAADLTLVAAGKPGTSLELDRRTILRQLVSARMAAGVRLGGADRVTVIFRGRLVPGDQVRRLMTEALQTMLPAAEPGAPDTWLELEYQGGDLGCDGAWDLTPQFSGVLRPGRQTVRFRITDAVREWSVPVQVVVHHYAEAARLVRGRNRGDTVSDRDIVWEWIDLADGAKGRVTGRRSFAGLEVARTLTADAPLLEQDLREAPVVLAGDPVELKLARGGVIVTVRGHARRDGARGQTIPVRNDLTGRLINARVAGPGLVEWRY